MPFPAEKVADIVQLFRAGLGRRPELSAITHFATLLENGATFRDVAHAIAGSAEFRQLHGAEDVCDREYVTFLYRNGLGREPDPQGEANLLSAPNRGDALVVVAGSDEARTRTDLFGLLYPDGASPQDDLAYRAWLLRYDRISTTERLTIGRHIDNGMKSRTRFSLLIQVNHHRIDLFEETVASLENQIYPEWTLIAVYPDDLQAGTQQCLQKVIKRVPGIVGVEVPSYMGVEERWQRAMMKADGTFFGFLEPGDQLAATALYEFAVAVEDKPGLALIYCDEDRLGSDGQRCAACFKTAWSPELIYAGDVVGQLAMFRKDVALAAGGIREDVGAFTRYDLVLRITEGLESSRICHLSRVLFHRGRMPGLPLTFPLVRTTAQHPEIRRVALRHLQNSRPGCTLEDVYIGGNVWPRFVAPLPADVPLVSIIIPTKNKDTLLARCVSSLLNVTDYPRFEVLLADNGSTRPEMLELLRRLDRDDRVSVTRIAEPFNWSAINNRMARQARGDLLLFLNDDTEILEADWLTEMVRQISQDKVGVVGARLFYADETIQHAGMVMTPKGAKHILRGAHDDNPGYLGQLVLARDLMAVTGACMLVSRTVFTELGGFDESFPLTCNDVEFCLRVRQRGLRVMWTPHASLMHVDGGTRGRDYSPRNILDACMDVGRLLQKWEKVMTQDPFLNDNLLATDHDLILATPPRVKKAWRQRPAYIRSGPATRGLRSAEL